MSGLRRAYPLAGGHRVRPWRGRFGQGEGSWLDFDDALRLTDVHANERTLEPRSPPGTPEDMRTCRVAWQTALVDDKELLALAEQTLTEIKVGQGLSERHASVLAALRIRLKGSDSKSLEEMLEAAEDPGPDRLEEKIAEAGRTPKRSLDDLFATDPEPKPEWPS